MWDRLNRVTAPSGEVVSLSLVKSHLRVDHTDDDTLITSLIAAAVNAIDGPYGIGIALLSQQWRLSLNAWPDKYITLPLTPVQSVDSITYTDPSGSVTTLGTGFYIVDYDVKPLRIGRAFGVAWPAPRYQLGSIKVTFTAGYDVVSGGYNNPIPDDIIHAILLLVGHWYENRDAVVGIASRDSPAEMPFSVTSILERYRCGRIA